MKRRLCKICRKFFPTKEFVRGRCKNCIRAYWRERNFRTREYHKNYYKEWYSNPRNKKKHSEEGHKFAILAIKKYPEKQKARQKLARAKRLGLIDILPCIFCGNIQIEAHHPDYNFPLGVLWACRKDHVFIHSMI